MHHVAASVASSNAQDSGVLATYYQVAVSCGAEQRGATALWCVNTHDMAVLQPRAMTTAENALFWTGAAVGVLLAIILVIMALLYRFIRTPEIRGRCNAGAWALFVAILAAPTAAVVVFWTHLTDAGLPWTVVVVLIEVWWMISFCLIGEFIDQRIWWVVFLRTLLAGPFLLHKVCGVVCRPRSRVTDASGKVALVTGGTYHSSQG